MNTYKILFLVLIFYPFCFVQSKDYKLSDLIFSNGLYHEKNTNKLFNGYVKGIVNVKIVKGKYDGPYEQFFSNGQLRTKGFYVNGVKNGLWESYHEMVLYTRKEFIKMVFGKDCGSITMKMDP